MRSAFVLLAGFVLAGCDQFEDPDIAQIRSIEPDSGAIGSLVVIEAENLLDNTRVVFSDEVVSPIAALFVDDRVVTIVPRGAMSGDVVLETGGERSSSRADFTVIPAPPSTPGFFETETGAPIAVFSGGCGTARPSDDGTAEFQLPFSLPFYGRPQTRMFVATNGLVTFGQARPCDNSGRTSDFATDDKIAALGLDLDPGSAGEVRVNAADPEKVVVTWSEVAICGLPETSNTLQLVLFPDGRIRLNYGYVSTRGVGTQCRTNSISGSIVGITPRTPGQLVRLTYSVETPRTIGPDDAVFNLFFVDSFFDLENHALLFTPVVEGGVFNGYRIELLPAG